MIPGRRGSIARRGRWCLGALVVISTLAPRLDGAATTLRTVRLVPAITGGATTVILEADGPLPEPLTGALDGPPRVYLDLEDVRLAPGAVVGEPDSLVRRTRVAVHSASPLVTRVVIDMVTSAPYRIDASGRGQGRLIVILGATSPTAVATPPLLAVSGRPKRSAPTPSSTSAAASSAVATYIDRMSGVLIRLKAVRPVLESIDRRAEDAPGSLEAAAVELEAIGRLLAAIRPPASREPAHGLLVRACALGVRSSRMRQDSIRTNDVALGWNAASAAGGALMLLDRVSSDLKNP